MKAYACITWNKKKIAFTVFRQVFHSILKLKLCRHPCRRRDQIIPTCRYGKNMPTTALVPYQIIPTCRYGKNMPTTALVPYPSWYASYQTEVLFKSNLLCIGKAMPWKLFQCAIMDRAKWSVTICKVRRKVYWQCKMTGTIQGCLYF